MMANMGAAESHRTEACFDEWVLSFSLDDPCRALPDCDGWVNRGPHRCAFHGLLFEREALARLTHLNEAESSNAELVLAAYEREGEAALSRLRGSFVVAIVDGQRRSAIVMRDLLGSHPLFYVETSSRVLFAASPRTLLKQPNVPRALNRAALADHLCWRWPHPQETFYEAVHRVPPCWRAIVRGGRVHLERYWSPIPSDRPIQWLKSDETELFDEIFTRAVDRCLHNGPTGIFLSGGLDSISVAAVAVDCARSTGQNPLQAFSLGFSHPSCDERARQASAARDLGIRQLLIDFDDAVGSRPMFEQNLELNQELSAPIQNPWQSAYLQLAQRARLDGVRTIITGHGGDEWLTVTPVLAADLIRQGAFAELAEFFGVLRRSYNRPLIAMARHTLLTCGLRPLVAMALHRLSPKAHDASRLRRLLAADPVWVAPDRDLRTEQRRRAELCLTPADPPEGFYLRDLTKSLDHPLVSMDLEERHEVGERIGVRFMHPFSDPDVVELLCRTPPPILSEGGRTKGLVRQTLARRFPRLGFEQQRKVMAVSFYDSLMRREGAALAEAAGDFPALSALGIVDGAGAKAFVREQLKQPDCRVQLMWEPINLEMWVRSNLN